MPKNVGSIADLLISKNNNVITFKQILYLAQSKLLVNPFGNFTTRPLAVCPLSQEGHMVVLPYIAAQKLLRTGFTNKRGTWAYTLKASVWPRNSQSLCVQIIVLLFIQQIACSVQAFRQWSAARSERAGKISRKRRKGIEVWPSLLLPIVQSNCGLASN